MVHWIKWFMFSEMKRLYYTQRQKASAAHMISSQWTINLEDDKVSMLADTYPCIPHSKTEMTICNHKLMADIWSCDLQA